MTTVPNGQLRSKSGYLPSEVLSMIFAHAIPVDALGCAEPDPCEAPLNVSHVCRLWRQIALQSARLWTGIHFATAPSKGEAIFTQVKLLDLYIERSAHLLFGVRLSAILDDVTSLFQIEMDDHPDYDYHKGMRMFVESVLKCSDRWRVVEIMVPELPFATPIMQALSKSTTIQHFGVMSQYLGLYEQGQEFDFSNNTSLETARFVTPLIRPAFTPENPVRLTSLTSLELHFCPSYNVVLNWIDMCPNLFNLGLRIYLSDQNPHISITERQNLRVLKYLDSLELTFLATNARSNPGQLLDILVCPSLTELEVDLNYMYDSDDWTHTADFLSRSKCSVEQLTLLGTPMTDQDVLATLAVCPRLDTFTTDIAFENVVRALSPRLLPAPGEERIGDEQLLDHLESLRAEADLADARQRDADSIKNTNIDIDDDSSQWQWEDTCDEDGAEETDTSRYAILCPRLSYLEVDDVSSVPLPVLCTLLRTRCPDFLSGISEFADTEEPGWSARQKPTPDAFKTFDALILPYDEMYNMLSHPTIIKKMEDSVWF